MRHRRSGSRALNPFSAAAAALAILLPAAPACAQAPTDASSGAPLQENMPHSWFRNYDYGVELDGKVLPEAGLYQMIGKPFMLVFGSVLDTAYVWSADPRVVRPIRREQVTSKGEDEVMVAEASFAAATPIPWMQDGPEAVIFYAGQRRYKILRVPPIIGPTTPDDILRQLPAYRKGMDEYRPALESVSALKGVRQKVTVEVWFGSWCPHCRVVVPRFLKVMQAAANTNIAVAYHGVPHEFGTYTPAMAKDVKGLPTFIFTKDGKELGRIRGEPPTGTLEEEIARILRPVNTASGG